MNELTKLQLIKPVLNNSITSPDDCAWQKILNVGYNEWQSDNPEIKSYSDVADFLNTNYGPLAKMALLIGKYNQQVCNGGHVQYLDNGFASAEDGGFGDEFSEFDLHTELTALVKQYGEIPLQSELVAILDKFALTESTETCGDCGGSGEYEEEDEEGNITDTYSCGACHGQGEIEDGMKVYNADKLDDQYYKINEQVEAQFTEFFNKLLGGANG